MRFFSCRYPKWVVQTTSDTNFFFEGWILRIRFSGEDLLATRELTAADQKYQGLWREKWYFKMGTGLLATSLRWEESRLTVRTPYAGKVMVDWQIRSVKSDAPLAIRQRTGREAKPESSLYS